MTVVWILLAVLLVAAVGAIPSALRDPTIRTTSDASAVPVLEDIAGSGGGGPLAPAPAEFTDQLPDSRAQTAIDAALSQVGVPYQWGGDGPAAGDQGFDCSGLTVFAYAAAGISLPRTAHTQYAAGPHVPGDAALQPGDLVFYGTPSAVHHVGVYVGDGRMVNAPTYGLPVQVSYYRWRGDDFLGATRPAATGERRTGLLEFLPQPLRPFAGPRTFDAPRAPALTERVQPSTTLPPQDVTAAAALAATEGTTLPARSAAVPSTGWRPAPAAWVLPMGEHEAGESAADRVTAGSAVGSVAPGTGDGIAAPAGDEPAVRSADRAEPGAGPGAGLAGEPVPGPVDSSAGAGSAAPGQTAVRTDATVGTLTLPAGPLPLYAARLDDQGVPVPPAPGTAALLDEGGAQLVLLAAADLVPLDATLTVAVDGEDPRDRTVVEAETVTAAELAEQVRSLPEGEFQVAAPAADGSWTVAELE
jgi:cell wall-associated NlpC family hydrolase